MRKTRMLVLLFILIALLAVILLPGCTYTSRWHRTMADEALKELKFAKVSFTQAEWRPGMRSVFFGRVTSMLDDLPTQPGLIGYAYRFEIFGRRAWTITAWQDEASRMAFVRAPKHAEAMKNAAAELESFETRDLHLTPAELPPSWRGVVQSFEEAQPSNQP